MELTREVMEFIRQAIWGEGRCSSAKLQEQGQAILLDIARTLDLEFVKQNSPWACDECNHYPNSVKSSNCENCGSVRPTT